MKRWFSSPGVQGCLLAAISALLVFPNLGAMTLWDEDEGLNAGCAREMREAGTVVVPTFNWELRTAKPIFLYWQLLGSYEIFGVCEWSARLPSAVMFMIMVLAVHDLARKMFDNATGFLAGIIAASCFQLNLLAHACTTDSTLIAFTVLYIRGLWLGTRGNGRGWHLPTAIFSALAMLTKGPSVGLILLSAILTLWLWQHRMLATVLDRRMIWASLIWGVIAIPWYALIASETRGEWPRVFFLNENLGRATSEMERHGGVPVLYELLVICLMFAPWSVFLYITIRTGWLNCQWRWLRDPAAAVPMEVQAHRLLFLWIGVFFLACAAAKTKLPHYIAPSYPALAILTAVFLSRWRRGGMKVSRWVIPAASLGITLIGVLWVVACLMLGGVIPLGVAFPRFPELAVYAPIGAVLIAGGLAMLGAARRQRREAAVAAATVGIVTFVALIAAFPMVEFNRYKAPHPLVAQSGAGDHDREIALAQFQYPLPTLVYYAGRSIVPMSTGEEAARWLEEKTPRYLFIPEPVWREQVQPHVRGPHRIAAEHGCLYRSSRIVVITNE